MEAFMLHIDIICIGKIKESFFREAISEYSKRLSKYCLLNIVELPDEKIPMNLNDSQINLIKDKESNNIISHIRKGSYTICLDLNGKELTSEQLASEINSLSIKSNSNITFIIGGSLGVSKTLLNYVDNKVCFSKLTFPHQLFRSFKILNGETYHK